jgi:uncharacterized protein YqgC (DUF456 family)
MQAHGDNIIGMTIGAIIGTYKSIAAYLASLSTTGVILELSWSVALETAVYALIGAIVGLLATHFGKKVLKKLKW